MCGIGGYVNLDGRPLAAQSATPVLTAMGDALHHRGPDDTRIMLWESVGFIFKRLSIVDLAGGAQPLETADGGVCAMVNGEIYNHREIRPGLARSHVLRTQSAAHDVAAALKLPNHQVHFDEANIDISPDDWRRVLWHCEMPHTTAEQLFKFYLHAFARERHPGLKVMLLGQGSDEFNGGYPSLVLGRDVDSNPDDWGEAEERLRSGAASLEAASSALQANRFASESLRRAFVRAGAGRLEARTAWDLYVARFRENLALHLWHEDRTAAAHSIENRVPFLDYRVVEFLARVPVEHHAALFVNKQILRRAAEALLPRRFAFRPKGYFFYGPQEEHVFRMMYAILQRNGGEPIEQAIAGSARTDGLLEPHSFRAYAADIGRDPARRNFAQLVNLVNMGVLADMADRRAQLPAPGRLPVDDAAFPDWARAS